MKRRSGAFLVDENNLCDTIVMDTCNAFVQAPRTQQQEGPSCKHWPLSDDDVSVASSAVAHALFWRCCR